MPILAGPEGQGSFLHPLGCTVAQKNKMFVCPAAEEQHAVRKLVNTVILFSLTTAREKIRTEKPIFEHVFFFLKAKATVLDFVWSFLEGRQKIPHFNFW